ncbi:glutamine synthetase type III N terminal-domain-containing protein [Glomus cerebriforme]|uniref:Glutamine synthetase type III N terminal-domain-containing protein n=1 Tax=Glomus cerebriforme TaxID=658196 RepID=A0A397THD2_9GLOM|nr:glutamine synthetase type III N terminal-domain-containing protein [Glomus cerebriforme]
MSQENRINRIIDVYNSPKRVVEFPKKNGTPLYTSEFFGENVFSTTVIAKCLPKPIYQQFIKQVRGGQMMDKNTTDSVAHAARIWAMDRGATHFTHWFQPQTGSTAEKHDSFLSLNSNFSQNGEEIFAIDTLSGSQLLQSEPDASSFPSGGMRSTFEARGYTVWDTTSPMFIQPGPHGTSILYIPSIFISYNGEALDEKTVLLRSSESLSKASVDLLKLINPNPTDELPRVTYVYTTLGTEQEFFLIDRGLYSLRPDLKITGRTLVGRLPPKHQQMEDHYFGRMPSRVLSTISETELELIKLGVPIKTRHNEVAPSQFEMAPIFEEATIATDHNLLTMDVLHRVAHNHKLKVLFHEKPFKGINGSGKHCNWSLSTNYGENLLDPTSTPETNYRFLLFLVAILDAVHTHGSLLRAGISSASNDHRLGANEAPPGIISIFLGEQLTKVLDAIEENRSIKSLEPHIESIKVGGTVLDMKISTLPEISRDLTDRNRTSPFAFTGNKFEFRAVGSKQSPSFPVTLLNSAVASSIQQVSEALLKQKGDKPTLTDDDKLFVIRQFIKKTKNIRFEGDNYSEAWAKEAETRGLPNIKTSPEAYAKLLEPINSDMLTKDGIFSKSELHSRYYILLEKYTKDILVEARTLESIIKTQILPIAYEFRKLLAEGIKAIENVCGEQHSTPEKKLLKITTPLVIDLQNLIDSMTTTIKEISTIDDPYNQAEYVEKNLLPLMEDSRLKVDGLEEFISDKLWPLPKYNELLFYT